MNTHILINPNVATILGALVADAASLGLHWLYDPARIAAIEENEDELVFRQPSAADYAGAGGFFAHGDKQAGDSTSYGEICLLMLKHLAKHGEFNRAAYQLEFRAYFGPGGAYAGYIDSPTRHTLRVLLPLDINSFPEVSGADDDQLPALATIPVLVATHRDSREALMKRVEEVVRITNNNDIAVSAARCAATALHGVLNGKPMVQALTDAVTVAGEKLKPSLEQALATDTLDSVSAAERFGLACHVTEGLPIVFHIARHAPDYTTAIKANIRAGGDCCGRAIVLGALVAACQAMQQNLTSSIPISWLAHYRKLVIAAEACEVIG
ncbi:ADP-ribosylglycohydrolase family protein [Nitrosomonas sp. Nm58]|uniref:ADP-ribosylglycohydrolase family protein n=1 Tax=Nitrosomonas sp. Nm58 TaxID=200126 RepID=UPI000896D52E|nr:ADP-ribosylglycohydrolase family protein [Nitrosomonas sp. Nm58]SDZ10066.1 ADP-ribosylglycohydrolase [Nitrosomonas sp. Nm58]